MIIGVLQVGANVDYDELSFYFTDSPQMINAGLPSVIALRINKLDSVYLVVDNAGVVKISKFLLGVSIVEATTNFYHFIFNTSNSL